MKRFQTLCLILLTLISGCKKSNLESVNKSLIGKWTYTEYSFSVGGPALWQNAPPNQTIEFKPDGKFISAESFLKSSTRFEMIDSTTIKFQPASTSSGFILMAFTIKPAERELDLYPVNPICIDGCSYKFKK